MPTEIKKDIKLEIGHVLFIDIVSYSKLLIDEQRGARDRLNRIVRSTQAFRSADGTGTLIKSPTGDGMALVFRGSPEEPVECAIEINRAIKENPELPLRIGIHSGPVSAVVDVNDTRSMAGPGINMAQRVMDCGDAGHILISKHVAGDLEQYAQWKPLLHDLGECEVKHGVRVEVVNFYSDDFGNSQLPQKFELLRKKRAKSRWTSAAIGSAAAIAIAAAFFLVSKRSASPLPEKSIAVLPFENLSRDPDNAYFAVGIQDEILTRLAKIGALKVISHTSTQHFDARPANLPEIARQLGVANILEGSVQRAADQAHINVQLIRAATNEHLWAESYDRKLENIFGVEAEVATSVAEALRAKLTGAEQHAIEEKPTNNLEAYDAYLRGIALWREDVWLVRLKAIQPLEEAVRLDPNFAIAWAMLARVNSQIYSARATAERAAAAQAALDNALRLKPSLPEVQVAQGFYQYWVLRDYEGAGRTFESLRAVLPNQINALEGLGMIKLRLAQPDQARFFFDQAIKLNPRDRILRLEAAWAHTGTRDFTGALQCLDEALKIWPDSQNLIETKAGIYQSLGKLDEADALLKNVHSTKENLANSICEQAILRRQPASAISSLQNWLDQSEESSPLVRSEPLELLGDLQRLSGNLVAATSTYSKVRDELEQALREEPANADWIYRQLAWAYVGLGDRQRGMEFLDKALNSASSPIDRLWYEETRARIAARFGQAEVAIPILDRLLDAPYGEITPAILRLHPDFDPLRGNPQFEKLAHSDGN